jgi:hypothetical protein
LIVQHKENAITDDMAKLAKICITIERLSDPTDIEQLQNG